MRGTAAPLRLTLRVSRGLYLVTAVLAVLAALALHLSRLPDAGIVLVPLLAWLALRRAGAGLPLDLLLRADGSATRLDPDGREHPVHPLALHERGALGVLVVLIDGRRRNLPWAADSLPRTIRRDLRLWMGEHARNPVAAEPDPSSPRATAKPG